MPSDVRPLSQSRKMSRAYQNSSRRRSGMRIVLLLLFAGIVYYCFPSIPWLPTPDDNHGDLVRRVGELRTQLEEKWPWSGYATHRPATIRALDRLEDCLEKGTCGEGEKTIIVLGSYHFGHSQHGHTSGEDIWAASLIQILQANNYTLLYTYETLEALLVYQALGDHIPLVILEAVGTDQCLALGHSSMAELQAMEPKIEGLEAYSEEDKIGCAKRVGFEEGIPIQKIRSLHFWHDQRHPLPGFTIAPENYTSWPHESSNYYLGYHLEHCRHVKGALPHERRAFILGKKPEYFTPEKYAWPTNVLEELSNEIGGGFEFVGAAGRAGADQMPVKGVKNLGGMPKDQWSLEVARSGVMLGIGNPPLSPSPYDALCLGVPFINPVLRMYDGPVDRKGWLVQHYGLKMLDPPYVYNVWHEDKQALREAIESALATPFEPYIPERMKRESVEARLLHLIHHNWTEVAEQILKGGKVKGFANLATGAHASDGLLL